MKLKIQATISCETEIDPEDFREAAGADVPAGEDIPFEILQKLMIEELQDNDLSDNLTNYSLEVDAGSVKIEAVKE